MPNFGKTLKTFCVFVCVYDGQSVFVCMQAQEATGVSGDQKTASVVNSYIHSTIFEMGGVSLLFANL